MQKNADLLSLVRVSYETQDRARDIAAAQAGWEQAKALISTPEIQFVLLDEINIALRYDYLDVDEIVQFLLKEKTAEDACSANRPKCQKKS